MDCIKFLKGLPEDEPVVSVPVRGMDCIGGTGPPVYGADGFSPREGYGLHPKPDVYPLVLQKFQSP